MRQIKRTLTAWLSIAIVCSVFNQPAKAKMDLTIIKEFSLEAQPLDVATSADGKWIFILVPGHILVYSNTDNKITERMSIDSTFNRLTYSPINNSLILFSTSTRTLRIIEAEPIHDIEISGLPFKGPVNAPVTIVVFSDYQ